MSQQELTKTTSIKELINEQDNKQKMNILFMFIFELYRVIMGALLIIFVPQDCDGEICSLSANFNRDDNGLTKIGFSFNIITLSSFIILYIFELNRENKMIKYLHVNPEKSRDNDSVKEALEKLKPSKKNNIWKLDYYYKRTGYICIATFSINTIYSIIIILMNYLNDKTITVLLTNVLFMGLKINDVFTVLNTEDNVFLSSYLTRKIQFNDIDPDYLKMYEENKESPEDYSHLPDVKIEDIILESEPENNL